MIDRTLRYLMLIRLVVIGGQCFALYVMDVVFRVEVPWPAVSLVLLALGACTALGWRARRYGQRQYLFQSSADIAALSALVYFTGGAFNPFISLFLLPIVFAAAVMKPLYIAGVTLLAAGCYTVLMFVHVPMRHTDTLSGGFDLHVWGMWYGFILSAACVALLVARTSRRLRARDLEIAAAREQVLKSERVLALGTMAAGTAHEFGTPLSSMALIAEELEPHVTSADGRRSLALLGQQLERCKEVLARMVQDAGAQPATEGVSVEVPAYLDDIVAEWRRRRPEILVDYHRAGSGPPPEIVADRVITQAIVNILDNAAEASNRAIEVRGSWTPASFALDVRDDGDGIAAEVRSRIGQESVTTKRDGMGIGLLLSRAIFERLGGTLDLHSGEGPGTHARITLPLRPLSTA